MLFQWISWELNAGGWEWALTVANAGVIVGLSLLLPGRYIPLGLALSGCFWTVVGYGDLLYYRYFQDIVGIYMMSNAPQLLAITDSIVALMQASDLLFFLDLPIVLVTAVLYLRRIEPGQAFRLMSLPLLVVSLGLAFAYMRQMPKSKWGIVNQGTMNVTTMRELGFLNYHIHDLGKTASRYWRRLRPVEIDLDELKQVLAASRSSMAAESPYAGCLKGKNLLFVQLESTQWFVIDYKLDGKPVMPFLNQLLKSSWVFDLYDQSHHGRSSDAEFAMLNSLHPPPERPLVSAFPDNEFFPLPKLFNKAGYHTVYTMPYRGTFWNARHMSIQYGFQTRWFRKDLSDDYERVGWGMPDQALYENVLRKLDDVPKPFFAYVVTLGNHYPFDELSPSQEMLDLPDELQGTMFGKYLQCARFRDESLKWLVENLRESSYGKDTILILTGDHDAGLSPLVVEEQTGVGYPRSDKIPSIYVAAPGLPVGRSEKLGAHLDLAPTVAHLFGLSGAQAVFLGKNLFTDSRQWVVSRNGYALSGDTEVRFVQDIETLTPEQRQLLEAGRRELDLSQHILQSNGVPYWRTVQP